MFEVHCQGFIAFLTIDKASQLRSQHEGQLGRGGKEAIVYMAEKTPCRVMVRLGGGGSLASCGMDSALEQVKIFAKPCREGGTT